jgi:hypothetical protein
MSKYSFLLQTEEADYFELLPTLRLRKHGSWLVAETIEQEEISRTQSQATIRAVQLAKRVAADKDITLEEAFNALQGGADLTEMELLSEYTEDTLEMLTGGTSAEAGNAKLVTAFIRTRGQGLIDGEWAAIPDWTFDDTKQMDKKTITKALEFIVSEQSQGEEEPAKKASKRTSKTQSEN